MRTRLRRVGNSRGILIPATLLKACGLEEEVELQQRGKTLVVQSAHKPREGWFKGYRADRDADAWPNLPVEDGTEDWTW